jgi:biofilm PGA synthesis N-glycosyltransferase PgaC
MTGPSSPRLLTGGVVAFNERRRIRPAIESLLGQELPPDFAWGEVLVVVSGSTDGTEEIVANMARDDARIRPIVEPRRNGKAAALGTLFRQVRGEYLVLLNGDALAGDGSVRALLAAARGRTGRFAVMARPVPGHPRSDGFGSTIQLLWSIHHAFHVATIANGTGNHLSDELLLLPASELPPIPAGVVNDGSFIGGWLAREGGALEYAPEAIVRIACPRDVREHVRQRRRILFGHRQIRTQLSVSPTTLEGFARRHPVEAVRLVARETRRQGGVRALTILLAAESAALGLAVLDRGSGRPDHVRWKSIAGEGPDPLPAPVGGPCPADGV